jgi:hypothetical protein
LELKHRLNSVTAKCAVLIGEGQWEVSKWVTSSPVLPASKVNKLYEVTIN